MEPLRVGVLGAARISDMAIVQPARSTGTRLVCVAARDPERAREFADAADVERVLATYQDVIDDPEVEVVYNPLPNGLHGPWNLRAIAAGKHVLTEKPYASNTDEARRVRDAAAAAGVHVIEAFHYRYHPVMNRVLEIAESGEIGSVTYLEGRMLMPPPGESDPRWVGALAGGSLMDVGCYAVHGIRDFAPLLGGEPEVVRAQGGHLPAHPGVDAWLSGDLVFPSGVPAHLETSMTHGAWDFSFRVVGSEGEIYAPAFVLPQKDDRVIVTVGTQQRVEQPGTRSTYTYQLEAMTALVREGRPMITDSDDAVQNMQTIDDLYAAAGMPTHPVSVI